MFISWGKQIFITQSFSFFVFFSLFYLVFSLSDVILTELTMFLNLVLLSEFEMICYIEQACVICCIFLWFGLVKLKISKFCFNLFFFTHAHSCDRLHRASASDWVAQRAIDPHIYQYQIVIPPLYSQHLIPIIIIIMITTTFKNMRSYQQEPAVFPLLLLLCHHHHVIIMPFSQKSILVCRTVSILRMMLINNTTYRTHSMQCNVGLCLFLLSKSQLYSNKTIWTMLSLCTSRYVTFTIDVHPRAKILLSFYPPTTHRIASSYIAQKLVFLSYIKWTKMYT